MNTAGWLWSEEGAQSRAYVQGAMRRSKYLRSLGVESKRIWKSEEAANKQKWRRNQSGIWESAIVMKKFANLKLFNSLNFFFMQNVQRFCNYLTEQYFFISTSLSNFSYKKTWDSFQDVFWFKKFYQVLNGFKVHHDPKELWKVLVNFFVLKHFLYID